MLIYDREKNEYFKEKEYAKQGLKFLYTTLLGRILLKLIFSTRWYSKLQSLYYSSRLSKRKIGKFISKYDIDMNEYCDNYNNFSSFFTRSRKIEQKSNDEEFLSISDAYLQSFKITNDLKLNIKQSVYSVEELIQDKKLAQEYKNGVCLVYRLSMPDYHRYVFVDDGHIVSYKKIKGKLHTIRKIASKYNVYTTNSRDVTVLDTKNFGQVVQVEVGAMLVGKITNHEKTNFKRLEEKGYFDFGGSTIVMLLKDGKIDLDEDIIKNSKSDIETKVKIGMKIGKKR